MAFFTLKELQKVDDEDLEYIPDQPDFIDGETVTIDDHPTNEIHTGELPSEQDPRDKVEENGDYDGKCESFEVILEFSEPGDMTDLIENSITSSRLGAWYTDKINQKPYTGKPSNYPYTGGRQSKNPILNALLQMKDKSGNWRYKNEADAALNYNLFDDKNVKQMLFTYGLSNDEIKNFADIRRHQLSKAKQKAYEGQETSQHGFQKTPEYYWGQGAGVKISPNLTTAQQAAYNRLSPQKKKELSKMSYDQQRKFWSGMQSKYPQFFQPTPAPQPAPIPLGSRRSLGKLRSRVNLVGGLLAMPRTAEVVRQTADLVSAVHELDDGKSLDEITRSALRNTSRNLLTATDHLKSVNNRIANRVAGEIEQLYVDALSA